MKISEILMFFIRNYIVQKRWMATNGAAFRAHVTALMNNGPTLGIAELRSAFEHCCSTGRAWML
jgi:hypothetical protein